MLLMVDNFDSFTYNLVQYFGDLGKEVKVVRNNKLTIEEAEKLQPEYLVISPGPCTPNEAGISKELIRHFAGKIPILGVCLGHQAIGEVFGAIVGRGKQIVHGKKSYIKHDGKTLFNTLPNPLQAVRYHSLTIMEDSLPECLEISARSDDGEIMAIRHKNFPIEGVQFHPESFMTQGGMELLQNFLKINK